MRVGIVGMHYSPEPSGNAPYTTGLANGLVQRGYEVRALTGVPHYPDWAIHPGYGHWASRRLEDGVCVQRLRHYVPSSPSAVRRLAMEVTFGARALMQSARWRPDVMVVVSPALVSSAMVLARARAMRNRPALGLWVQDLYSAGLVETEAAGATVTAMGTRFEGAVFRLADGVAVIHDRFQQRVTRELGVPRERVRVIRNWTHLESTGPRDTPKSRSEFGWPRDEIVVLHAGNMGVKQGLENIIAAAHLAESRGDPVRFVLLGGGNQRPKLEGLASGLQRVDFVDSLPNGDFQNALAAADVLLVNERPGVRDMSVPSKLTSYFTSGRPVLAATEEGSATAGEITASGAGWRVPPGQPEVLLDAVLRLGREKKIADDMGAAGVRYCEEVLSRNAAISRFEEWLTDLVENRNH